MFFYAINHNSRVSSSKMLIFSKRITYNEMFLCPEVTFVNGIHKRSEWAFEISSEFGHIWNGPNDTILIRRMRFGCDNMLQVLRTVFDAPGIGVCNPEHLHGRVGLKSRKSEFPTIYVLPVFVCQVSRFQTAKVGDVFAHRVYAVYL